MFRKKQRETPYLNQAIEESIRMLDSTSDEFLTQVEGVERLMKLKEQSNCSSVSPDTLAIIVGNIVGIVLILHYEQLHPIASKAMSHVLKLK